jgi:cobalt-zinc-cadmium efflux system outer membrane protein
MRAEISRKKDMSGFGTRLVGAILVISSVTFAGGRDAILDNYIQEALTQNPSLKAAAARVKAFEEMIPQSNALPDPRLGVGLANLPVSSFAFDREPMTGKWISLSQTFPFPGKLGLKRTIAQSDRDEQTALLEDEKASLIRLVKETYYTWAFIRESLRLVETNQSLMDQFVTITISKYEVGNGLQQDVLRAQTERTDYDDRLLNLRQTEETLKARLNTLLNRDVEAKLEVPTPLEFEQLELHSDSLIGQVLEFNRKIQALYAREQSADAAARFARKSYYPDFMIGAQYTQRDDAPSGVDRDNFFSVKAEVAIPLYWTKKQNHMVEQKRIELRRVNEELKGLTEEIEFQVTDLLVQEKRIRDQITVYREGIIPLAQQTLESSMASYQIGKVDFLTLLSNQTALLNHELELEQRILNYKLVWCKIEALTGRQIL